MFRGKQNSFARSRIALIVALLSVSLILIVGVAWGRYRTGISGDITLQSRQPTGIYLYGGKNETGYTPLTDHWQVAPGGGGSSLSVLVTNTDAGAPPSRDVHFSLRLAATQGIGEGGSWSLSLHVPEADGSVSVYPGAAQAIAENTQLYGQFGDGWVYRFYDVNGAEVEFTLPGDVLSEWQGSVVCNGTDANGNQALLQLQVIARDN